jgi:hypothetical protein
VTLNEIKRLGDTGISRYNNVDAFLVGAASNPAVQNQLKQIGIKYVDVTAGNIPELANKVDQLYGSIEEPDTGVRNMANGALDVMVGSMDGTDYQLPAPGHALGVPHGFGSPVGDEEQRPRSDGDGAEAAQRPGPHLLVQLQADEVFVWPLAWLRGHGGPRAPNHGRARCRARRRGVEDRAGDTHDR